MSGSRCQSTAVSAVEDEGEQPPRERRETRGHANELGLGLRACSAGAGLYIGREGRPGSNGHREGWPRSNDHRAWGRAGRWSGPCPCLVGVLGFQPNTGTGAGSCLARARGRSGRVVRRPCLNKPCSCRPNGLSPFEHLYSRRPWKTSDDFIHTPKDLPSFERILMSSRGGVNRRICTD
jgi:hypothetical protein